MTDSMSRGFSVPGVGAATTPDTQIGSDSRPEFRLSCAQGHLCVVASRHCVTSAGVFVECAGTCRDADGTTRAEFAARAGEIYSPKAPYICVANANAALFFGGHRGACEVAA